MPNFCNACGKQMRNEYGICVYCGVENRQVMVTRRCPYCAEEIQAIAIKCKHCGEILDPALRATRARKPDNVGLAAVLSFIVPGLGQIYKGQIGAGLAWLLFVVLGYFCFVVPGLILHLCCIFNAYSSSSVDRPAPSGGFSNQSQTQDVAVKSQSSKQSNQASQLSNANAVGPIRETSKPYSDAKHVRYVWLLLIPIGMIIVLFVTLMGTHHSSAAADSNASAASYLSYSSDAARKKGVLEIDVPKLAFANRQQVEETLGRAIRIQKTSNMMNWSEGSVLDIAYRRAEATFLKGRLMGLTYKFKRTPEDAWKALEASGLPPEAVSLDNEHFGHLPFRAFYAPNPQYRNPIRCCGLLIDYVSIPEDRSEIVVSFANINTRFADWPNEERTAWLARGGTAF